MTIEDRILTELIPDMRACVIADGSPKPVGPDVLGRLSNFGFELVLLLAHGHQRQTPPGVLVAASLIGYFRWWGMNKMSAADVLAHFDAVERDLRGKFPQPAAA